MDLGSREQAIHAVEFSVLSTLQDLLDRLATHSVDIDGERDHYVV